VGIISLSNAFDNKSKGDKYAAILSLVGIINLPVIKWSVDWWNTLHQPASISKFSSPSIDTDMLSPLFVMTLSFLFLSLNIIIIRIKSEILQRKIDILNSSKIN
jgi:heme exporter protein C